MGEISAAQAVQDSQKHPCLYPWLFLYLFIYLLPICYQYIEHYGTYTNKMYNLYLDPQKHGLHTGYDKHRTDMNRYRNL
jgi:hypothetical protein